MTNEIPFDTHSRKQMIKLVRYYFFLCVIGSPYLGFARANLINNSNNPAIVSLSSEDEELLTASMLAIKRELPLAYKVLKMRYADKETASYKDVALRIKISTKRAIYLHDRAIKFLFYKMMRRRQ